MENEVGTWDKEVGLQIYESDIWQRRKDLRGSVMRWTMIDYPILSPVFVYDEDGNIKGGKGYLIDIMNILSKELNFTVALSNSIDEKFGKKTNNGSYNGMVGMLIRNETDVVAAHLTITEDRSEVIDYTIPWKFSMLSLIVPVDRVHSHSFFVYMLVWENYWLVWCLIGTGALTCAVAFYVTNCGSSQDSSNSDVPGFLHVVVISLLMLMQLTYRASTDSTAAKIAIISASLSAYLLFAYWHADITAGMTTGPRAVPIRNFRDVMDNDYRVITRPSTSNSEVLRTAREGTPMQEVWNWMKDDPSNFPLKVSEGLEIISNDPKALFWATDANILGNAQYEQLTLEEAVYTQNGFGLQKSSEFREILNYWIAKLDENGMMHNLMNDWTYKGQDKFWIEDAVELGYQHIAFPFILLVSGAALAILVLLYEKITEQQKKLMGHITRIEGRKRVEVKSNAWI